MGNRNHNPYNYLKNINTYIVNIYSYVKSSFLSLINCPAKDNESGQSEYSLITSKPLDNCISDNNITNNQDIEKAVYKNEYKIIIKKDNSDTTQQNLLKELNEQDEEDLNLKIDISQKEDGEKNEEKDELKKQIFNELDK